MANIKDTAEMYDFVLAIIQAGGASYADGKINLLDAPHFIRPFALAKEAFEGVGNILTEFKDLDESERAILFAKIEALNIPQDEIEMVVEKVFKVATLMASLLFSFMK